MARLVVFIILIALFAGYSVVVYTTATQSDRILSTTEQKLVSQGKSIYQEYNCQSCHQVYGLGGYLGPDLTNAWSDPARGENTLRAFLQSGGNRMPNFNFNHQQIESLIAYLKYIDGTSAKDSAIY
jgi:nitric oxide reductase subunit C